MIISELLWQVNWPLDMQDSALLQLDSSEPMMISISDSFLSALSEIHVSHGTEPSGDIAKVNGMG